MLFLKTHEISYLRYYAIVRSRSDVIVTIVSPIEYFSQAPECRFELQIGYLAAVSCDWRKTDKLTKELFPTLRIGVLFA